MITSKTLHNLDQTNILMVGVGGIGCQILKVVCKFKIKSFHILDMDTIEITNLNRQFLFKKQHKGMSKAIVARESVLKLNSKFNISAHHNNIKEMGIQFFKEFQYIILALDNVEARNYVNKLGVRLEIPLIDAGTLAYTGNVTTIIPHVTKCYSCQPKNTVQNVFPVCTIRMRPEKPIHCVVWGKLLFEALFGSQQVDNDLKDLIQLLQCKDTSTVLKKLYIEDIENIKNAKEDSENKPFSNEFLKKIKILPSDLFQKYDKKESSFIEKFTQFQKASTNIEEIIPLFIQSFERLLKQKQQNGMISFQKDDDDIIHFISSAANLRMHSFSIELQSFNQIKNMAGNIVPAIASTNAIVAGLEIIEMAKYVRGEQSKMKKYYVQNQKNKTFAGKLQQPLETCTVCGQGTSPFILKCDFKVYQLKDLIKIIQKESDVTQFSLNLGSKEIFNSEEPKQVLLNKNLFEFCDGVSDFDLILTDQDEMEKLCVIWVVNTEGREVEVEKTERLKRKIKKEKSTDKMIEENGKQLHEDDDDVIIFEDDQQSPELVQVKKAEVSESFETNKRSKRETMNEVSDEVKKKMKLSEDDAIDIEE